MMQEIPKEYSTLIYEYLEERRKEGKISAASSLEILQKSRAIGEVIYPFLHELTFLKDLPSSFHSRDELNPLIDRVLDFKGDSLERGALIHLFTELYLVEEQRDYIIEKLEGRLASVA